MPLSLHALQALFDVVVTEFGQALAARAFIPAKSDEGELPKPETPLSFWHPKLILQALSAKTGFLASRWELKESCGQLTGVLGFRALGLRLQCSSAGT